MNKILEKKMISWSNAAINSTSLALVVNCTVKNGGLWTTTLCLGFCKFALTLPVVLVFSKIIVEVCCFQ